jgi:hypothetical protein
VRELWVRPCLGYYLGPVEDDRRSILENSPMSHHFTMREEELFKIGMVRIECLATLLHQGIEGGLENVSLVGVRSVVAGVFTLRA